MSKKIIFIFLIAFLIRLIALNQSFWQDEATTAKVVQQYSYSEIITKFSPQDFHPPLYYLFMKFWTNFFGYSEIALRMPSVLFSLATGYIVYLIAGIWGAIFFLYNPLIVYYSQEARMYMMATFFLTVGIYYFLKSQKLEVKSQKYLPTGQAGNSKLKSLFLMNLFCTVAFFSFYGSAFLIVTAILYSLIKKDYKVFILNTLYFILVVLIISPLLYQQLINAKTSFPNVANWNLVLGKANLKNLLLIPIKFSIGRIGFYPKWLYYLIAGGWTAFIISQILNLKSQIYISNRKSINLFLFLFIFPLILGFVVSFWTPLLQYFRFLYLIPIMCILLAKNKNTMFQYVLVAGFVTFSLVYLLFSQFHREDWKSLVKSLPDDKPVYMILASSDPLKYYNHNLTIKELKNSRINELENEIIVIPFTAGVYGFDYKTVLKKKNFSLTSKKSFRELELENWKRIN